MNSEQTEHCRHPGSLLTMFSEFISFRTGITLELLNYIKALLHSSEICDHLLCTVQAFHDMGSHYTFANTRLWCSGALESLILLLLNELKEDCLCKRF